MHLAIHSYIQQAFTPSTPSLVHCRVLHIVVIGQLLKVVHMCGTYNDAKIYTSLQGAHQTPLLWLLLDHLQACTHNYVYTTKPKKELQFLDYQVVTMSFSLF